jgi:hypothetical protein
MSFLRCSSTAFMYCSTTPLQCGWRWVVHVLFICTYCNTSCIKQDVKFQPWLLCISLRTMNQKKKLVTRASAMTDASLLRMVYTSNRLAKQSMEVGKYQMLHLLSRKKTTMSTAIISNSTPVLRWCIMCWLLVQRPLHAVQMQTAMSSIHQAVQPPHPAVCLTLLSTCCSLLRVAQSQPPTTAAAAMTHIFRLPACHSTFCTFSWDSFLDNKSALVCPPPSMVFGCKAVLLGLLNPMSCLSCRFFKLTSRVGAELLLCKWSTCPQRYLWNCYTVFTTAGNSHKLGHAIVPLSLEWGLATVSHHSLPINVTVRLQFQSYCHCVHDKPLSQLWISQNTCHIQQLF